MENDFTGWKHEYAFGLPDVDFEHEALFAAFKRIIEANKMAGSGVHIAVEVELEFLIEYVDKHFRAEEKLLAQTNYPKLEEHKKLHKILEDKVMDFKKSYASGTHDAVDKFIPVAAKWLANHILKVDREYVEYCKQANVGTKPRVSLDFEEE